MSVGASVRTGHPAPVWLAQLRPRPDRPLGRVVMLPHSGAGPNTLLPVAARIPDRYEVVGVTLPGRERRFGEAPEIGPQALVAELLDELAALPPLPTVLFGHSLGASAAVALAQASPQVCAALVLSAQSPGGSRAVHREEWPDSALRDLLALGGGTSPAILDDPVWRDHVLTVLRADVLLSRSLAERIHQQPVTHRMTVLGGADDLLLPAAELDAWQDHALHDTRVRVFPGGHFYLFDEHNAAEVAAEIAAAFPATAAPTRTGPAGKEGSS
ncbi:thioesterase II family protein [Streptomyces sp. NPDC033754]|uniref:thioesterase II family protein n=1 Tax=unclassified Streptomyces TaxID=2593676 RepID=UPI0033F8B492